MWYIIILICMPDSDLWLLDGSSLCTCCDCNLSCHGRTAERARRGKETNDRRNLWCNSYVWSPVLTNIKGFSCITAIVFPGLCWKNGEEKPHKKNQKRALWHWSWQTLYCKSSSKQCSRWDNAHVVAQWVCAIFWNLKYSYYVSPLYHSANGEIIGSLNVSLHRLHRFREQQAGAFCQGNRSKPQRLQMEHLHFREWLAWYRSLKGPCG